MHNDLLFSISEHLLEHLFDKTDLIQLASVRWPRRERGTMPENIATYTDATFDEQIGSSAVPVVVDFWAEWCGPCKMVAPILEEIAEEQAGSLAIAKLNVDDNPDVARRFGVMSIPTMIVFKDGQEAARIVGAKGKSQLLDDFKPFI